MKKINIQNIKNLNLYSKRHIFYLIPLVVVLVMIICGVCYQASANKQYFANIGIDFQGGTIMQIEFTDTNANSGNFNTNVDKILNVAKEQGITSFSSSQTSGANTIIVQYTNWTTGTGDANKDANEMNDINNVIKAKLFEMSNNGQIDTIAENGITFSTIGSESSRNLLKTSIISVVIALAFILVYIIIRFDFYSGLAAIIALIHDVLIMLSLTVIFYVEIGDSIVAGLITIVAYSINNTIVVFDKVRSIVKPLKKSHEKINIPDVINTSVAQTLTRTIYTTITTLVVMIILVSMGVVSITKFGLPIIFGLIAGFYSSVFIAAPLWGDLKSLGDKIKKANKNRKLKKRNSEKNNDSKVLV